MKKDLDTGIILAMLGKISKDVQMNKAMLYTQLELTAKSENLDFEKVLKRMESLHAQYVLRDMEIVEELTKEIVDSHEED